MPALIEPRILKGFRDFLPPAEIRRRELIRLLEKAFQDFGFVPIDTPALEYTEVLLGKGGGETDKQVYAFQDQGGRNVALRFDLTVPFARFLAAHREELYLPFKRYHIAKVWRGENTQRGRYREFTQCDFDIVGSDCPGADFEILLLMASGLELLGIGDFHIHLSHRGLFNGLVRGLGLGEKTGEILRAVDKLGKTGPAEVLGVLSGLAGEGAARQILDFTLPEDSNQATWEKIQAACAGFPEAQDGLKRLAEVLRLAGETGLAPRLTLNPSITRGLDYYDGLVYETFLDSLPRIGSVCSGGRYNNLAGLYSPEALPGVGASIGLDRLLAALEELGLQEAGGANTPVIIFCLEETLLGHYHNLARSLRAAGVAAEVYPEGRKLKVQFALAEKKGIPFALICGGDEHARGVVNLKDLRTRESLDNLPPERVPEIIRERGLYFMASGAEKKL